ncbi:MULTISPECIES: di-trans,poly-cis-decaprenylcistransferase [Helicobacter]|uniref:Isoprenyl transferase n=1 Tax=Helicobacter ibis TaxID=2962633 RepID=A0ABT4VEM0_9HELI|nr:MULTISPECIES: di-trans,poly-cis-decaprenylcistransferase [Helicobacter]MDA3967401.1 di-trans,poly-cis-decaprenylcistransferase [Helicobacter sp. WB40]MDA3969155.1 di-trans,poly-cis-decaprenylcistransferase [Helicobacter ibis]
MNHLAIIMDGNGRWAKKRFRPRIFGHQEGAKNIEKITEFCLNRDIKYLTLYAFSTENWKRPKSEVEFLMDLLERYIKEKRDSYIENKVAFRTIGDISIFSDSLQESIRQLELDSKEDSKITQILALNYGSRDELRRAFLKMKENDIEITEENISKNLDTAFFPEVDMLIRTGGECRLSNFLLWQCAYAELFFSDTLWPDFSVDELDSMVMQFSKRNRKFGGILE